MPDPNATRVEMSELASRLRMHPASLYARAVAIGVPVARAGRRSTVGVEDARRIEASLQKSVPDTREQVLATIGRHAAAIATSVLAEMNNTVQGIATAAIEARVKAKLGSAKEEIAADLDRVEGAASVGEVAPS